MTTTAGIEELAPGLWRWTARHPDWHPGEFGAEVGSYAAVVDGELVLVDPQLPDDERNAAVLALLDELAAGRRTTIAITIGYHLRSSEALADRYGAEIRGPKRCAWRLERPERLIVPEPGEPGPAGIEALAIGKPVRDEHPVWLASHRAVVFGDALAVTPAGELRIWDWEPSSPARTAFYRDAFSPTLEPIIARNPERILTTHGPPILSGGADAMRAAVAADPWNRHEAPQG